MKTTILALVSFAAANGLGDLGSTNVGIPILNGNSVLNNNNVGVPILSNNDNVNSNSNNINNDGHGQGYYTNGQPIVSSSGSGNSYSNGNGGIIGSSGHGGLLSSSSSSIDGLGLSVALPLGIDLSIGVGPYGPPPEGSTNVFHPPHPNVIIDGCDHGFDNEWHYVHPIAGSNGGLVHGSQSFTWGTTVVGTSTSYCPFPATSTAVVQTVPLYTTTQVFASPTQQPSYYYVPSSAVATTPPVYTPYPAVPTAIYHPAPPVTVVTAPHPYITPAQIYPASTPVVYHGGAAQLQKGLAGLAAAGAVVAALFL